MEAANEARGQEEGQEEDVEQEVANKFARQIDLVQKRYGWTDEQIKQIPSMRFFEIVETIVEARRDEDRQRLKEIAYGQWCAYHFIPLKKGSKHMNFKSYCDAMGLGKKTKPQWEEKTTEEISAATKRIRERHGRSSGSLPDSGENPDKCEDGDS